MLAKNNINMLKKNLVSLTAVVSIIPTSLCVMASILIIGFALLPISVKSQQPLFETGVISELKGTGFLTSAYPVIDRLENGRLVCVFSCIADEKPSKMNIAFSISDDNGLSWFKPQILFSHSGVEYADPRLLVDSDGVLAFSSTVSGPGYDGPDFYISSLHGGVL